MGRPAFVPSADQRKEVEIMARYGIPEDDIALDQQQHHPAEPGIRQLHPHRLHAALAGQAFLDLPAPQE
jgi:hypothetical protein